MQLTYESQAPQLMDCPGVPQSPTYDSQASESSSSIAAQAPYRRIFNISNTSSQLPQHDIRPGSQSMSSVTAEVLPRSPFWSEHCLDFECHQLSAPPLQASPPIPPSVFAPGGTQQDLASSVSQSFQQYIPSETSDQYSQPTSYFEDITPSVHSHERYGGGGTTTFFRGSERSRSGHGCPTYNVDGTPLTSMDASSRRIMQGFCTGLYDPGAEQSNELGPNILSGMGSWDSPWVPGRAHVSINYHGSDGLTLNPSLISNLVPVENDPARQDQGTRSQEIGYLTEPSARGVHQSLLPPYFPQEHGTFVADANNANRDADNSQNEGYHHNPDFNGNHRPNNLSALASSHAPEPRNIPSSIPSGLTPSFDRSVHIQVAPKSSIYCGLCDRNFSNPENLRRHNHEQHGRQSRYRCKLIKDGLVCSQTVTKRNRRRHVESIHSVQLPLRSQEHRPNRETSEMLDNFFDEIQQGSAQ